MQGDNSDLGAARDAALECILAVNDVLGSVYTCADGEGFLANLSALDGALGKAERSVTPLLEEFARADQHKAEQTCAGVSVTGALPSSHALAWEVAKKFFRTLSPTRTLPRSELLPALREFHKGMISVMPGGNSLQQLAEATRVFSSELDTLRSRVWLESSVAEAIRHRPAGKKPVKKAAKKAKRPIARRSARAGL